MDEFLLDCCFKSCGTQNKFSQLTPRYTLFTLPYASMQHSPRIADELRAMQSNLISTENIFC
jgi:hypothetical protein